MRSAEGGVAYAQIIRREGENSCMGGKAQGMKRNDKRQQMLQSIHRSVFAHKLAGKSSSAEVHNPLSFSCPAGGYFCTRGNAAACLLPSLARDSLDPDRQRRHDLCGNKIGSARE